MKDLKKNENLIVFEVDQEESNFRNPEFQKRVLNQKLDEKYVF